MRESEKIFGYFVGFGVIGSIVVGASMFDSRKAKVKNLNNLKKIASGKAVQMFFEDTKMNLRTYQSKGELEVINIDSDSFEVIIDERYIHIQLDNGSYYIRENMSIAQYKAVEIKKAEAIAEAKEKSIRDEKLSIKRAEEVIQYKLNNSPLFNYFGAIKGDEYHKILYYLRIDRIGKPSCYKIGITDSSVLKRYAGQHHKYTVLFEKNIKNAKEVEKNVINYFQRNVTNEPLLKTKGSEIFNQDVLKLSA